MLRCGKVERGGRPLGGGARAVHEYALHKWEATSALQALCSRLHAARGTLQWLQEGPRDCRQCEPRQRSWLAVRAMYSADVPCTERTQGRARGMQPCRAAGLATWRASSSCVILSGSVTRRMAFSMVLVRMMRLAQSSHMAPSDLHTRSAAASRPSSDYAHHTTGTPAAEIPRQCA